MALPARSLEPAPPVPVPGYNGETFLLNELAGPSSSSSLHTHTRTHTPTLSSLCSAFHSKRLVYFSETHQVIPQQQQTKIQSPSGSSLPVYDTLLLTFSHSALSFASRGEHYHFVFRSFVLHRDGVSLPQPLTRAIVSTMVLDEEWVLSHFSSEVELTIIRHWDRSSEKVISEMRARK